MAHDVSLRHRLCLAHVQAALWSVGNSVTSGAIITYLLLDLHASGMTLSWILAASSLVGVLRLLAPRLMRASGSAKALYLLSSLPSGCLLAGLCVVRPQPASGQQLSLLLALLMLHQLAESLAQVALWTWLGDLTPRRLRARYFARRQFWQLLLGIPAMLLGGAFVDYWRRAYSMEAASWRLLAYYIPLSVGTLALLVSLVPMLGIPATSFATAGGNRADRDVAGSWLTPWRDRQFLRLLLFRAWFSMANGITQTPQSIYPRRVLGFGLWDLNAMRTCMQLGQAGVSPWMARWINRYGNRRVLMICQAITAGSLLFFTIAAPDVPGARWWLLGGWIAWIAYVGHNIGLPKWTLDFAPPEDRPAYFAAMDAVSALFHAGFTLAGGWLLDTLMAVGSARPARASRFAYLLMFHAGFALRLLGVLLLRRVANGRQSLP